MPKRKEAPSITIANLERENRNLAQRCGDLVNARDENHTTMVAWKLRCDKLETEAAVLRGAVSNLSYRNSYSEGYIARVKETDKHFYGELKD